jgi:cysteine desulfurase/selenocysteine lyase
MFPIDNIRADFPILHQKIHGKPLVYLDNAATTQSPIKVIDAMVNYYKTSHSNVHRGVHSLSQRATDAYESARQKIQTFFGASNSKEIIFTSGTTHGINIVANGFTSLLKKGDEVLVSQMEHHSNIVPLQMLCKRTGAILKVIPMNESGELNYESYLTLLSPATKLVFINHVSNVLGTINPIKKIIDKAHEVSNAAVLIDGAQSCPHIKTNVMTLDCDFYVASAHKLYGPTGIGFLYGKEAWLNKLNPSQFGGSMIDRVTFEETSYADLPYKFEAGTQNIAGAVGFAAALDYLQDIGYDKIAPYENELLVYAQEKLLNIDGLKIYGTSKFKASVISFNIGDIHPYDLGSILDKMGIAVRTGHHCAQPIIDFYQIPGTVRASFALYNTKEEIDTLIEGLLKATKMLS